MAQPHKPQPHKPLPQKSHARPVFGVLAGLTGATLIAAFVAPFYGALDRPVTVIEGSAAEADGNSGNGIVVEQFDYTEPKPEPEADSGTTGQGAALSSREDALEREQPRAPLSDLSLANAPSPAAPVDADEPMQLLQRPIAIAAGRLESQGRIVELQGIELMLPEQTCQSASGESWPCGMQARTAFRQWLRSRAIMCRLPQNDSGGAVATQCNVGDDDAALWLVTNGWAKATFGGTYEEAGQKAQQARLGVYGDKPDTALPELAPESVPETPPLDGEFPPAPSQAQ